MNKKLNFNLNGFHIEKSLYTESDMDEMFSVFYDVFLSLHRKFLVPSSVKFQDSKNVKRENDLQSLDGLMLDCYPIIIIIYDMLTP
jgi:hypothetical protein